MAQSSGGTASSGHERHLKRLMSDYVSYYHEDRTHLGLEKNTPAGRPIAVRSGAESEIQSLPRLGGLHHRYVVAAQTQELFC
jgi:putative transposase